MQMQMNNRTVVYTDGACKGNPGPGGWAWVVLAEHPDSGAAPIEKSDSGGVPNTTNNRMELQAVLEAINSLDDQLLIITDSRYVSDCFEKKWWVRWEQNKWRTKNKEPVKNQDLWQPIINAYKAGKIEFDWVEGHSGDPGNEAADTLASQAAIDLMG